MALGYSVYEDDRDFEQRGLTGEVQRYTTAGMKFPCLILVNTTEKPLKMHSIDTLKRMFPNSKVYNEELNESLINIYVRQGDKTVSIGMIQSNQVKTFLKLFENNEVVGYIDADTELKDMYLYVLSE